MTWTTSADARRYGSTLLQGDRVRFRALEDHDLADLVRWWRDPEWSVLQQMNVRPRPDVPVTEMFRSWSNSERSGDSFASRSRRTVPGVETLAATVAEEAQRAQAGVVGTDMVVPFDRADGGAGGAPHRRATVPGRLRVQLTVRRARGGQEDAA